MTIRPVGPPRITVQQEGQFVSGGLPFWGFIRFILIGLVVLGGMKLLSLIF